MAESEEGIDERNKAQAFDKSNNVWAKTIELYFLSNQDLVSLKPNAWLIHEAR